jgi:hypothetical protein
MESGRTHDDVETKAQALVIVWRALLPALILQVRSALRWLRARLRPREDAMAVLRAHTADRAFWQKPEIAALLLPPRGASLGPSPAGDPREYLRAILEAGAGMSGAAREALAATRGWRDCERSSRRSRRFISAAPTRRRGFGSSAAMTQTRRRPASQPSGGISELPTRER